MTSPTGSRDVLPIDTHAAQERGDGRKYVVAIGIDGYRAWGRLHNAVADARGARDAFVKLGFEERHPLLLDEAATGAALHRLVTDQLRTLHSDDSLVVFFAGHGHTVITKYPDGTIAKLGYLMPFDAERSADSIGSWVCLDSWLHHIAHLPPKHILVVIDACNSGVALNPVIRWRGEDVRRSDALAELHARRSRRIITSALDNQLAMDGGPIPGHSLFTGCLIEALTGGLRERNAQPIATGSEIALHVQRRVSSFPSSRQTPDFGALELDDRGELIIQLAGTPPATTPHPPGEKHGVDVVMPRKYQSGATRPGVPNGGTGAARTSGHAGGAKSPPAGSGVDSILPKRARTNPPIAEATPGHADPVPARKLSPASKKSASSPPPMSPEPATASTTAAATAAAATSPPPPEQATPARANASPPSATPEAPATTDSTPGSDAGEQVRDRPSSHFLPTETAFVAALDRHQLARQHGRRVMTLVTADPMTGVTGWANWAAARGQLTLVTDAVGLAATTASLLEQMPWLRILSSARTRIAAVAKLAVSDVDAALDTRSASDREAWIDRVAGDDVHARVSGWLLSMIRESWGGTYDPATAPVQGGDLLAALGELAAPISVLFHDAEPTASWLERAIQTAAELVEFMPGRAIAVSAPGELAVSVISGRTGSAALDLARRGQVPLASRTSRIIDPTASRARQLLHTALARDPRTAGLFEPNVWVPTHDRAVQVDLFARDALLAVEIDNWYQFRDPRTYDHDRNKDRSLARAQFFVMRFLIEDVEDRIEQTVNEIAIGLAGRRASGSFVENS